LCDVTARTPPPERLATISVGGREIRPVDVSSINDPVEPSDHLLVGHRERDLEVVMTISALQMRNRPFPLKEACSPGDFFRRWHPSMVRAAGATA